MNNFTYSIPTKIHFGKGQIKHLNELKENGNKVLLVYGSGSIKRAGIYDQALEILKDNQIKVFELSGVEPNPRIETVRKGVQICKALLRYPAGKWFLRNRKALWYRHSFLRFFRQRQTLYRHPR